MVRLVRPVMLPGSGDFPCLSGYSGPVAGAVAARSVAGERLADRLFAPTVRGAGEATVVCFSVQSDLAVGIVLVPVGIASLREVRHAREVPFQPGHSGNPGGPPKGDVSASVGHRAAIAYLVIALPLLPFLVPLAVLLLEPGVPAPGWCRSWASAPSSRRTSPSPWPPRR